MRHPTIHKFLVWVGPSLIVFAGGSIGLIITAAQEWDGVASWAEYWFYRLAPVVNAPWFMILSAVLILGYIGALIYTGSERKTKEAKATPSPDPKPGPTVWKRAELVSPRTVPGSLLGLMRFKTAEYDYYGPSQPPNLSNAQAIAAKALADLEIVKGRLKYVDQLLVERKTPALQQWRKKLNFQRVPLGALRAANTRELTPEQAAKLELCLRKSDELEMNIASLVRGEGYKNLTHAAGLYRHRANELRAALQDLVTELRVTDRDRELRRRRQEELVSSARDLAAEFLNSGAQDNFKSWVEVKRAYLDIQPFLGAEYKQWLRASQRTAYVVGGNVPYEVTRFLAEIARLEAEWNL